MPTVHRAKYFAALNLGLNARPPVCLQYVMWALACSVTPRYSSLHDIFYRRARRYAENDEMKGFGESMISVAHCQAWSAISAYEFKMLHFPRAWSSAGKANRLATMMGLHRVDGIGGLDVKQCIPPPRDWLEKEERRRTFWQAYCQDRYASVGTGWPMGLDEKDVRIFF